MAETQTNVEFKIIETSDERKVDFESGQYILQDSGNVFYDPTTGTDRNDRIKIHSDRSVNVIDNGFGYVIERVEHVLASVFMKLRKSNAEEAESVNALIDYLNSASDSVYANTRCSKVTYEVPIEASAHSDYDVVLNYIDPERMSLKPNAINYLVISDHPEMGYFDVSEGAHAEGVNTIASEYASHAEGYKNKAIGQYSHAEGRENTAMYAAHAEGRDTIASGEYSHAEGRGTKANANCSHSEGWNTEAPGYASHSEGRDNKSTGDYSHTEGYGTQSSGYTSHAEGLNTKAQEAASHAEGFETAASGRYSHAEGRGTIASGNAQHVSGMFNRTDTAPLVIVGNGSSDSKRSNAFTLDREGNAWFAGDIEDGNGNALSDIAGEVMAIKNGMSAYATKDYVDNLIGTINSDIEEVLTEGV